MAAYNLNISVGDNQKEIRDVVKNISKMIPKCQQIKNQPPNVIYPLKVKYIFANIDE